MTQKAPERIWAWPWPGKNQSGQWSLMYKNSGEVEYVHIDHATAKVASAYEDAADTCFNPRWPLKTSTGHVQARTAGIIRARTDAEAQAALGRVKREARNEALESVIELAVGLSNIESEHHDKGYSRGHNAACLGIAGAIAVLISEDQSDE